MKASELRIGNLLEFSNGIQPNKIITVGRRFFSSASFEKEDGDFEITPYYRPIEITEEWLTKFGFEGQISKFYKNKLTITLKDSDKSHLKGRVYFNSWAILEKQPEYVHELQNLYFALTGRELELKTKSL